MEKKVEVIDESFSRSEDEPHCLHYVRRKKRYCKMTLKQGYKYCGEHLPKDTSTDDNLLRVTCPLDRKHTCYAHNLKKHLKICNAKPKVLPFISKGINQGDIKVETESNQGDIKVETESNQDYIKVETESNQGVIKVETESNQTRLLANAKVEHIKQVIGKIIKISEAHKIGNIKESFKTHKLLENELENPDYGAKSKKHLVQVSSILGLLEENNLLQDDTCYIEFGAGKGKLSFWISQAIESFKNSAVLLVERASHRHKMDNKVDKSTNNIHRVKADIGDLILNKVDIVNNYKNFVGLTKHLCGDATDLTLRCMTNFIENGANVSAFLMAFCCHHRCQWSAFTGKDFFLENDLSKEDFDIMCGLVSWAICGTGQSREKNDEKDFVNDVLKNQRDKEIGLSREDKKEIGLKSKNLIDYARTQYLIKNGFKSELQFYVPSTVSPENVCVIAIKNNKLH